MTARGAYANLVLPGMLADRRIVGRDAAFATELAYGTLRSTGQLDKVLELCSSRPLKQVDPRVLELLRLGAYQLLHMRVPAHAAVAATVEVARVAVTDGPAKFVNAVLRRVAEREFDAWMVEVAPDPEKDPVAHLAIEHSHPEWIVRAFADALERSQPGASARWPRPPPRWPPTARRPPPHLVARPGRIDRDELLAASGGTAGRFSPYAIYLDGGDPAAIEAVRDNRAAVQDEGSQLCALALANVELAGADERWLDLCAGPGGKTGVLGALAAQRGASVVAVEQAEHRANLVARTTEGLPVTVVVADGRSVGEDPRLPEGGFDRVLVDAPCTGLGALRRRPEARWRRQLADVKPLVKLQRELAVAALTAVRPGGVVGYVVCSPHLAETRVQVADVVRRTGAELVDARPLLPDVPDLGAGPTVQLWPHRQGTDAMFLALLRRK